MSKFVFVSMLTVAGLVAAAGESRAAVLDRLVMKSSKQGQDGFDVDGRIREIKDDKIWIIVNDGENEGPISVPIARVKRIEYDFDGRRRELPAGDFAARYKFALWELELGAKDEARFDLEAVVGKPGVPPEAFLLLARLQDEREDIRGAWGSYHAYLDAKPTDAAKIEEARKAIKRLKPLLDALPAEPQPTPVEPGPAEPGPGPKPPDGGDPAPEPGPTVEEGLESYPGGWRPVPWADPATVELMTDKETGNKFLAVNMSGGGGSAGRKTAIQLLVGRNKRAELKSAKLMLHAYNPDGEHLPVSVAFTTGNKGTYHESELYHVPRRKGWHTLKIDLNGDRFKSEATDWAYKTPIKDKDDLKSIIILINVRRRMTVFLDYIKPTD